jgi:RNA polymerase subunit RPABC4/transcription elongation factor Spt4
MGLAFTVAQDVLVAGVAAMWLVSAVWVWRDARARCDPGRRRLAFALAAVPFAGPVLYAALRPCETELDRRERRAFRRLLEEELDPGPRCLACRTPVEPTFRCCPGCGLELKRACDDCGSLVDVTWAACPHCASPAREPLLLTA